MKAAGEARMSVAACLQVSPHACVMRLRTYASMGIWGPLFNCAADSGCLSHARLRAHAPLPAQRRFFKKASLPQTNRAACMSSVLAAV